MSSSYFSLDDILSESETLSCNFEQACFDLGYLDDSNHQEDVAENTTLDLPFWMAEPLLRQDIVSFTLPSFYGRRFKSSIHADPEVVSLREQSPFFYELGLKLSHISGDEDICVFLRHCFLHRFGMILHRSGRWRAASFANFLSLLSCTEREVFDLKTAAFSDYRDWRKRKLALLQCSPSVSKPVRTSGVTGQKRFRD